MPLLPGVRTRAVTRATRRPWLAVRRAGAGVGLLAVAVGVGVLVHGMASVLGLIVAIPAAYTLAAAARPWVAPCPACDSLLGAHTLALPDEPVVGPRSTDIRCPACGIYVDSLDGEVQEVPFNRRRASPDYTLVLAACASEDLRWGSACLACGRPAACGVPVDTAPVGVLTGPSPARSPAHPGDLPFCAAHGAGGHPTDGVVLVARARDRLTFQFSLYAAYRAFLDGHRDRAEVSVRSTPGA